MHRVPSRSSRELPRPSIANASDSREPREVSANSSQCSELAFLLSSVAGLLQQKTPPWMGAAPRCQGLGSVRSQRVGARPQLRTVLGHRGCSLHMLQGIPPQISFLGCLHVQDVGLSHHGKSPCPSGCHSSITDRLKAAAPNN